MQEIFKKDLRDKYLEKIVNKVGALSVVHYDTEVFKIISIAEYEKLTGIKAPPRKEYNPLIHIWRGMKARCNNPNSENYKNYGGRGIKVCKRWENSFDAFVIDIGERPSTKHSVDRINNNRNYTPSNCRWATAKEQANNRRNNINQKRGK